MENEKKKCPTCGHLLVEYTYSFNKGHARFLIKLFEIDGPAKTDDLGLTYSQRTNSQKLAYWGLAIPYRESPEARQKRGYWKITEKGKQFVRGEITIDAQVVMSQNRVVRYKGRQIHLRDAMDGYDYYEEYKNQASMQLTGGQGELFK